MNWTRHHLLYIPIFGLYFLVLSVAFSVVYAAFEDPQSLSISSILLIPYFYQIRSYIELLAQKSPSIMLPWGSFTTLSIILHWTKLCFLPPMTGTFTYSPLSSQWYVSWMVQMFYFSQGKPKEHPGYIYNTSIPMLYNPLYLLFSCWIVVYCDHYTPAMVYSYLQYCHGRGLLRFWQTKSRDEVIIIQYLKW